MEIMLDDGLLGEFDYHGDAIGLDDFQKPRVMNGFGEILGIIGFGIGALIAFILLLLILGSCMGCNSCISCFNECGSCVSCDCGTKCSQCGRDCRGSCGCKTCADNDDNEPSGGSSGCGSTKYDTEVYHIVYEDGQEAELTYTTKKQGCSVVGKGFDNFGSIARDPNFFSEEGYYKKNTFKEKDMVITANGEIVGKLKDGATYYSKSSELYVGEERTIIITFEDGSTYPLIATVGHNIVGLPTIPTLEGYEFVGGYCNDNQVIDSSGALVHPEFHLYNYGSTEATLYIQLRYKPKAYKATIYFNSKAYSLDIKHNDLLKMVTDQAYTDIVSKYITSDQEFIGWSFTNKEDELIASSTLNSQRITQDITLYAITKSKKTITLEYNNGTNAGTLKVVPGRVASLPTEGFEKAGYEFVGWCRKMDLSDTPVTEITIDENTTLFAKWDPKTYTIEYRSELDDHLLFTGEYTYSETNDISLAQYIDSWTPNGYEFSGWTKEKGSTTVIVKLPKNTLGNLQIYATYSSKKFNVALNEGYGSLSVTSKQIEYGSSFNLPVPTIADPSQEFIGYYCGLIKVTDKEGNSLIKFNENDLNTTYIKLNTIQFTAKFDTKQLKINFYNDSNLIHTDTILYNQVATSYNAPAKQGYEFKGWSKDKSRYSEYDFNTKVTSNLNLYASYTAKTYTVTLAIKPADASCGTLTTTTYDLTYDQKFKLLTPNTNVAYNFVGYQLGDLQITDDKGTSLKAFNTANLNTTIFDIENGLTFTAIFNIKSFSVQYYSYDSSLIDTKTVNYGEQAVNKVLTTIPTGYEFKGWSTSQGSTELYDFVNSTITSDLKLYAVVEAMKFTVTLSISNAYGSLSETSKEVFYDSNYILPIPTLNEGYQFLGYKYNNIDITDMTGASFEKFTNKAFGDLTLTELEAGITLVANCKEIEYVVSYYVNGEVTEQRTYSYGERAVELSGPTSLEPGYRFLGWSMEETGKEVYNFDTVLSGDLSLYAILSNKYKVTLYASDKTTVLKEFEVEYGSSTWKIPAVSNLPTLWQGWYLFDEDVQVANKNGVPMPNYSTFDFTEDIKLYVKE